MKKSIHKIEVLNNLKKALLDATDLYEFMANNCFDDDWLPYFQSKKLEFLQLDVVEELEKVISNVIDKYNEENQDQEDDAEVY